MSNRLVIEWAGIRAVAVAVRDSVKSGICTGCCFKDIKGKDTGCPRKGFDKICTHIDAGGWHFEHVCGSCRNFSYCYRVSCEIIQEAPSKSDMDAAAICPACDEYEQDSPKEGT
jgi:hypothetical protein